MFRTRGLVLRKTVVYIVTVWYVLHQYKQSSRWKTVYTDTCKTYHTVTIYNRLSEDEPSGSKPVEDIKK